MDAIGRQREVLLQTYKALLCVALLLIAIHLVRYLPASLASGGNPLAANGPLESFGAPSAGPRISWGGQRHQ